MVSLEDRLERLGYKPECARKIVTNYAGRLEELDDYVSFKESEKLSISEHVTEVLG